MINKVRQHPSGHDLTGPYTAAPLPRGSSMAPVKQFTSLVSLAHVLMHALLITILMINMVMNLPALS